jgi:hypothetical protein
MHSHCDHCRAPLREGDIQLELLSVSCSNCGVLYGLTRGDIEELRKQRGHAVDQRQEPDEKPPKLPTPHWKHVRQGDVLHVFWRWYLPEVWCLVLLLLVLLATTVPAALGWREDSEGGDKGYLILATLFLFLFGYPILVSFLNWTHIEASRRMGIRIRHGPLPWFISPRTVKTEEVRQLYGRQNKGQNGGQPSNVYELYVQRHEGPTSHLVGRSLSAKEVLFLERTLERHLGIMNRPVPGEINPDEVSD